jgi:hypothetical protein
MAEAAESRLNRGPNFVSTYANNIQVESSAIDCKLVFGELDRFSIPPGVKQHTAVTMTWAETKLAMYYLRINLAIYEAEHGNVQIPEGLIPPIFTLSDDLAETPVGKAALERTARIREELLASL